MSVRRLCLIIYHFIIAYRFFVYVSDGTVHCALVPLLFDSILCYIQISHLIEPAIVVVA